MTLFSQKRPFSPVYVLANSALAGRTTNERNPIMKRREFLRTGLALGAATALPAAIIAETTNIEDEIEKPMRILTNEPFDSSALPPEKSKTLIITCRIYQIPYEPMPSGHGDVLSQEEVESLLSMMSEGKHGKDFRARLRRLEEGMSSEMGFGISCWAYDDGGILDTATEVPYEFIIERESVAKGSIFPDRYLAFDRGWATEKIPGIETIEPVKGMSALWIEESMKDRAKSSGYTVVEPNAVIVAHFADTFCKEARKFMETKAWQDRVAEAADRRKRSPGAFSEFEIRRLEGDTISFDEAVGNMIEIYVGEMFEGGINVL